MSDITEKIEEAREDLLDMSLRNKLLNFKEYKRSTAKIVDEVPGEIYQKLVLEKDEMSFLGKEDYLKKQDLEEVSKEETVIINEDGSHICIVCEDRSEIFNSREDFLDHLKSTHNAILESEIDPPEEMDDIWELPDPEGEKQDRYTDIYLQTSHEGSDLQKRLYNINRKAEGLIEDAGYNALHIALGFLEWSQAQAQEGSHRAPLILVPVKLEREGAQSEFKIKWNGEEVTGNLSLDLKLSEQGVDLPEFDRPEEKSGIRDYLKEVEKEIPDKEGWNVLPDIHIGFFDFTKFTLYQDLDLKNWRDGKGPENHEVIRGLLDSDEKIEQPEPFDEEKIDEELPPEETYHVKDADPSQIAAIEDVKRGRDLVVEGPPGTGKSQTIVNMIAELLAQDKKVLFVSEKMAALNVVKERLDSINIGNFCLELHSDSASKSDFLDDLERLVKSQDFDVDISEQKFRGLEQRRNELNSYADALRTPFGELQQNPYQLYGKKEKAKRHFEKNNREFIKIDIENAGSISPSEYEEAKSSIKELGNRLEIVYPIKENPWYGSNPGQVLPKDRDRIEKSLNETIDDLEEILDIKEELENTYGIEEIEDIDSLSKLSEKLEIFLDRKPVNKKQLANPSWDTIPDETIELREDLKDINEINRDFEDKIDKSKIESLSLSETEKILDSYKSFFSDENSLKPSKDKNGLESELKEILDLIEELDNKKGKLLKENYIQNPHNIDSFKDVLEGIKLIVDSQPVDENIISKDVWHRDKKEIKEIINDIENLQTLKENISESIDPENTDLDLKELLRRYRQQSSSISRIVKPSWYKTKKEISHLYMGDIPSQNKKIIEDIEAILEIRELEEKISEFENRGQELFGDIWSGTRSNPERLKEYSEWLFDLHEKLNKGVLKEESIKLVLGRKDIWQTREINRTAEILESLEDELDQLSDSGLYLDYVFRKDFRKINLDSIKSLIETLNTVLDLYLDPPQNTQKIVEDLGDLIKLKKKKDKINKKRNRGEELFGPIWNGIETDPENLEEFSEWIVKFRKELREGILQEESIEIVSEGFSKEKLDEKLENLDEKLIEFEGNLEDFLEDIDIDGNKFWNKKSDDVEFWDLDPSSLYGIYEKLHTVDSSIEDLDSWSLFDQTRDKVLGTIGAPIVDEINEDRLKPEDVYQCFEGNFADTLLNKAFVEREILSQFDSELHEDRIKDFRELDKELMEVNRKRVISNLMKNKPELMKGASRSSPAGTLLHEFSKERAHKPIRLLLKRSGKIIQELKPCFMMSPLSVAKYLDPESLDFDVVIFDEASQIRPEDAFSTILRGSQVVLFGDTKQLPPTSFFDKMVEHDESEDETDWNIQNVESILGLCKSSLPTKRLKWHYRSRHESLIAVSNQEFYSNELLIYPSPIQDSDELGLKFNHLPDTVYDRGGSSVNREEAREVAKAAVEHYRDNPNKSLGIGTFSQRQQKAVLEEVERLRKENSEIDEYFSRGREEHFFVKNLERIQGDERDVIFISVGYGYDQDGRFTHNFGPLNSDGGWRRLNVLITRAREKCVVFSNFTKDAIDLNATNARGVKSLKKFLKYAETSNLDTITEVGRDPDSPFERCVKRFIEEKGYEVHTQVGCAGFRIDLAIPDPDNPGKYVLGIECDGASYHSSQVARARDRQRQALLEDRGWRIYRIWSTDWYRKRENAKENLLKEIKKAINTRSKNIDEIHRSTDGGGGDSNQDDGLNSVLIEDIEESELTSYIDELSEPYERADVPYVSLSNHNPRSLRDPIKKIVEKESPIHEELLSKRLVRNSDVGQRGKKIKKTIKKGIRLAEKRGDIKYSKPFLYSKKHDISKKDSSEYRSKLENITVRKRSSEERNIELISDEEIEKALIKILEKQLETEKNDLIKQASRLLGFERTTQKTSNRIKKIVEKLVSSNIIKKENNKLNLK